MTWQKLTLHAASPVVETLSDLVHEAGAVAVTLQANTSEELFEPPLGTTPLWQHTTIHALFEMDSDLPALISFLQHSLQPEAFTHQTELVDDQDWQKNCRDAFQPVCFADKLWICPSWHPLPGDGKAYVLLDPGLAFGTGSHPTTQLCLEWLAQQISGGECVVDYGCGSGILALAALKLGAQTVWAVDNDPQALEATLENAHRNQLDTARIKVVLPDEMPALTADILVANILANPLIALAPHFANLIKADGKIALSGILADQAESVSNAYAPWFHNLAPVRKEEWVRLEGKK